MRRPVRYLDIVVNAVLYEMFNTTVIYLPRHSVGMTQNVGTTDSQLRTVVGALAG